MGSTFDKMVCGCINLVDRWKGKTFGKLFGMSTRCPRQSHNMPFVKLAGYDVEKLAFVSEFGPFFPCSKSAKSKKLEGWTGQKLRHSISLPSLQFICFEIFCSLGNPFVYGGSLWAITQCITNLGLISPKNQVPCSRPIHATLL